MSNRIIRGTTPSFIVDFSEALAELSADFPDGIPSLSVITKASLLQTQGFTTKDLSDGLIFDATQNIISYHFTQDETFAMKPTLRPCWDLKSINRLNLQMDIWIGDDEEAYRVVDVFYEVEDSRRKKVFTREV